MFPLNFSTSLFYYSLLLLSYTCSIFILKDILCMPHTWFNKQALIKLVKHCGFCLFGRQKVYLIRLGYMTGKIFIILINEVYCRLIRRQQLKKLKTNFTGCIFLLKLVKPAVSNSDMFCLNN